MESRTITIKGVGKAKSRPDLIVIPITLNAKDFDYQKTMKKADEQHDALKAALGKCGVAPEEIKTANFSMDASYTGEHDRDGNYRQRFDGYVCTHQLSIQFGLDMERLGEVLAALAACSAEPSVSVRFTLKDPDALMREALECAVKNARAKAEILAAASGAALGELIRIDHSWAEVSFFSNTEMHRAMSSDMLLSSARMDIVPDDVDITDSVAFVWALE